jgi:hypothetical protein
MGCVDVDWIHLAQGKILMNAVTRNTVFWDIAYLSIYRSTALLLGLGRFFSFLNLDTVDRSPWTGISPSQGHYLHTEQHKQKKPHSQQCIEWDSNP